MGRWRKFRNWANRDDGSQFQVGNRNLNLLEISGSFLVVAALIVYLLHDKVGFHETWIGWLFLVVGFTLTVLGAPNEENQNENT